MGKAHRATSRVSHIRQGTLSNQDLQTMIHPENSGGVYKKKAHHRVNSAYDFSNSPVKAEFNEESRRLSGLRRSSEKEGLSKKIR